MLAQAMLAQVHQQIQVAPDASISRSEHVQPPSVVEILPVIAECSGGMQRFQLDLLCKSCTRCQGA
eukprot:8807649-Pyramimonas_sp.AAC.1